MTDIGYRLPSHSAGTMKPSMQLPTTSATTASSTDAASAEPIIVQDKTSGARYVVGRYLGKGGFAKCYELTDMDTNQIYAGKVVSKQTLAKHRAKEKLTTEIKIHRSLNHRHVVGFHGFFEDRHNVYILLELCSNRSLMELHKARRTLTEPEARYYLGQIVDALIYLRDAKIIHRDLKLGNLFLNSSMEVKLGDFGLATTVSYDGERKKTLCGTPNYIAPEILEGKDGHSYEVDIWSFGCIMYTMLVGRPPFETENIKSTYQKIKTNDYRIPSSCMISEEAKALIRMTLNGEPKLRPSLEEIRSHPFMTRGFMPTSLPSSALNTAPSFDEIKTSTMAFQRREPLKMLNSPTHHSKAMAPKSRLGMESETVKPASSLASRVELKPTALQFGSHATSENVAPMKSVEAAPLTVPVTAVPTMPVSASGTTELSEAAIKQAVTASKASLAKVHKRLVDLLSRNEKGSSEAMPTLLSDERIAESVYISKWVDYSNKYGLGYQLTNGSVGVLFNDGTKMVLAPDQVNIEFIDRDSLGGAITLMTMSSFPESLSKKVTLLKYFKNYMTQHLLTSGTSSKRSGELGEGLAHVKKWIRTKHAIVFRLSNQCIQVNFFDHAKVIVDCAFDMVVYVDESRAISAFSLSDIEATKNASLKDLMSRLTFTCEVVDHMVRSGTSAAPSN